MPPTAQSRLLPLPRLTRTLAHPQMHTPPFSHCPHPLPYATLHPSRSPHLYYPMHGHLTY
ncbi:hypothetical protein K439DRAFT_1628020, partial [Ramaria rubella]